MAISSNMIGNLIGRHLKFDIGSQNYDASTGRGYVFSNDGRVGFFVDFSLPDGPKYAVTFSGIKAPNLTNANNFVSKTTTLQTYDFELLKTDTTSIFYKVTDAVVVDFDSSSIGTVFAQQGLTKNDFSNTAMLMETWIDGVMNNAPTADVSALSGIRGFIAGSGGSGAQRVFKLWVEMPPATTNTTAKPTTTHTAPKTSVMSDNGENLMLTDPAKLSVDQKYMQIDGLKGFDYLGLYFSPVSGITANFSALDNQTILYDKFTYKVKNFEGMDLTDYDDVFTGSSFDNTVYASKGKDTINGGGTWVLDTGTQNYNGSDRDWVQYSNGTAGITVKTNATGVMSVTDYGGSVDTLTYIEAVGGTYFVDRMYGGTGNYNQIFAGNKGADIIDGGGGRDDRVWHGDDPAGVVVNLSAKTVNPQSVTQFANSVKYANGDSKTVSAMLIMKEAIEYLETPTVKSVASNRALDGWGNVDVLSNIEAASGSNFNDQLYGSDGRNILSGGYGFDFIVANGGDDYLVGGFGHDALYGGLGQDWIVLDELNWGNLTQTGTNSTYNYVGRFVRDQEESGNIVIYKSVNESTTSNPDVVDGFVIGDDLIDLTGIDANTKRAGNQAFSDNIVTTGFTKTAGQLKISAFKEQVDSHNYAISNAPVDTTGGKNNGYKLSGTQLEGDVNGDGVADFTIKLVGVVVNDAASSQALAESILY